MSIKSGDKQFFPSSARMKLCTTLQIGVLHTNPMYAHNNNRPRIGLEEEWL